MEYCALIRYADQQLLVHLLLHNGQVNEEGHWLGLYPGQDQFIYAVLAPQITQSLYVPLHHPHPQVEL